VEKESVRDINKGIFLLYGKNIKFIKAGNEDNASL